MKVQHLFESSEEALRTKIARLKAQRKELVKTSAGALNQSGIHPRWKAQVDRLDAAIKAAGQDLEAELKKASNAAAVKHKADTIKAPPADHGKARAEGAKYWRELADKYGDEHKLNLAILKAAKDQTNNGKHPLSVESLAKHFGVIESAMYRRISSMEELLQLKKWYPQNK